MPTARLDPGPRLLGGPCRSSSVLDGALQPVHALMRLNNHDRWVLDYALYAYQVPRCGQPRMFMQDVPVRLQLDFVQLATELDVADSRLLEQSEVPLPLWVVLVHLLV